MKKQIVIISGLMKGFFVSMIISSEFFHKSETTKEKAHSLTKIQDFSGYYSTTQSYLAHNSKKNIDTDYDGADELKIYKDKNGVFMLELKRTMENYHMCHLGPTPIIFKSDTQFEVHSFLEEFYLEAIKEYDEALEAGESYVNPYLPEEERKKVSLDQSKNEMTPRPQKDWFYCVLVFNHEVDTITFYKDDERSLSLACASLCGARAYFPEKDRAISLKLDPNVPKDIEVIPK